ncbi:MAG: BolA family transcriptional regulator [Deltaproteobacteria bacterium]|jgi:stress-induced morphogen|nr:MAG: BolA family transcriptional regulator [Deltaproteobacteria bacterium]
MITSEEIKASLTKALPVSLIETQDLTGGGDHWQLIVVSPAFEGKGLVDQHRMVNDALKAEIGDQRIHALALKTFSPAQWEKLGS